MRRAAVCGGVKAGPKVFIASMKRQETPIKATRTQRERQTVRCGLCVLLLCFLTRDTFMEEVLDPRSPDVHFGEGHVWVSGGLK